MSYHLNLLLEASNSIAFHFPRRNYCNCDGQIFTYSRSLLSQISNGTSWSPILGNKVNPKPTVKRNTSLQNKTVHLGEILNNGVILIRILITIDSGFENSDEDDALLTTDVTTCFISVINIKTVELFIRNSSTEFCMQSTF